MPLGLPSIFSPCFFCSPHPPPPLRPTLSSSTSVTAALRPGSQEQLVCLPALLTTANLLARRDSHLITSPLSHTYNLNLHYPLRFLPYSQDATL